jgi:hypothetical protein
MDDETPVPLVSDEHVEHAFEDLPSGGSVEAPRAPADEPSVAAPPTEPAPIPEWAKGGKPPETATTPEKKPVDADTASAAGKTLAARSAEIKAEIDHLTWTKHATRREADEAAAELQQLRTELATLKAGKPATTALPDEAVAFEEPKPKLENFETYEQFSEALVEWGGRKTHYAWEVQRAREQVAREVEQQQQQQQQVLGAHYARIEAYRAAHPDYDDAIAAAAAVKTNPMMDTHLTRSEAGPALMHYLAQHPAECEQIAALAPGLSLVALGRIEERLGAAQAGSAPKAPPRSHAKPPIKPVGSSPIGADGGPPSEDSSLDDHAEYYNRIERDARHRR